MNFLLNSSSTLTSNSFEIFANVSMSGCEEFVHHFETVDGFTPNASDNHLLGYLPRYYQHHGLLPSSVLRAQFLGDLRLAYLSDLLFGCKDSEYFSFHKEDSTVFRVFYEHICHNSGRLLFPFVCLLHDVHRSATDLFCFFSISYTS